MTPEQQKAIALAKARRRKAEATSGNPGPGQQAPVQGQLDQLAMLDGIDRAVEGNPGRALTAAGQVTNATTWGNYDRLMGGVDQLFSRISGESPGSLGDSVSRVRENRQEMRETHPVTAQISDVGGAIAGGFAIDDLIRGGVDRSLAKLPQAKTALDKTIRYGARLGGLAGDGLAQYGAYMLGAAGANKEAEEGRDVGIQERVDSLTPEGAAISAMLGPASSGIYRGGRGLATGRMAPKSVSGLSNAPSMEAIGNMKNEAYKLADEMGVTYSPDSYQNLIASMETKLAAEGIDPVLHQRATRTLSRMQDRVGDKPMTMQELDKIRQFVRRDVVQSAAAGATPGANAGEQRLGMMMIDAIDDFIADGGGAMGANAQSGNDAIRRARSLNSVWRKSQALQDAVENAQLRAASTGTGGNFENALRQELRKIYQNPKKVAGFNEQERKMMRSVIEGNAIQNTQRLLGKFSPEGNGLMGMMGVGGTFAHPGFAAVPITGFVAKRLAEKGVKKKFDDLDELVRSGANQPPMKNITPPPPGGPTPSAAVAASQGGPSFNVTQQTIPGERGFLGRRISPDDVRTDYSFSTSGGNKIQVSAGTYEKGADSIYIDWINNGDFKGIRPDGLPTQSLGETKEILSGVEQAVHRIIDDRAPREIVLTPRTDQHERIYRAMLDKADLRGYQIGSRNSQSGPQIVLTRPASQGKPVAQNGLPMDEASRMGRAQEQGFIVIDGKPMRRKDAMQQAAQQGDGNFPVTQRATPPPPPGGPVAPSSGIMEGPLPWLAGLGAAGTAGMAALGGKDTPEATIQPPPGAPVPDTFAPSLKPNLGPTQALAAQRASQDARTQDQSERQEYWNYLKSRGDGSATEWNRINQERASELKVTPEDAARGVIRKRLPYVFGDTPVSVLSEAPIEELIDGHWRPAESARAIAQ